jgi:hypothetical protein
VLPFLGGVVFTAIGIYQLGNPNVEFVGWMFAAMGVIMAIVGTVTGMVLWRERKTPASQDWDGASP